MKYQNRKLTSHIGLIYGFESDKARYDLIATTHRKFDKTKIYGLLSRKNLKIIDFIDLWKFIQKNIETKYIEFEVIPSDAKVYKKFLKPIKSKVVKTFTGFIAEQITVLKSQKIRIGK